jgi:hypothetical protein
MIRDKPSLINEDLIEKNDQFHSVPEGFEYLDLPLKKDVEPIKNFLIVDEPTWNYFYSKYLGTPLQRKTNENGDFELKFLSVKKFC